MLLRPKHLRALDLLAHTDLPQYHVARKVRISPRTLRHWLEDPEFSEALKARQAVSADSVEDLRLRAARSSLARITMRLQSGIADVSIADLTRLLGQLSSERLNVIERRDDRFTARPWFPSDDEDDEDGDPPGADEPG